MIQSNFSYYKKDIQSTKSTMITPVDVSQRAKVGPVHKKSSKFTGRIIYTGGFTPNASMDNEMRAKNRAKALQTKKFNSVSTLVSNFEEEVEKLIAIQTEMLNKQNKMEFQARRIFAAIKIQTAFRCKLARHKLRVAKAKRFLFLIIRFRHYYKQRKRAAFHISNFVQAYKRRLVFLRQLQRVRCLKRIQRAYRRHLIRKGIRNFMARVGTLKITVRHSLLFGTRKTFHSIMDMQSRALNAPERIALKKFLAIYRLKMRMKA